MRRRGSTLLEVSMTLPILSALLVLAIGGVHQSMRVSRLAKDRGQLAYVLSRLEQSLRSDIHQADSVLVERDEKDDLLSLHLSLPDNNRIVYRVRSNRIYREQLDGTGTARSDTFALFAENKVLFEVDQGQAVLISIHRVHKDHSTADRLEMFVRIKIGRPHLQVQSQQGAPSE